MDKTRKLWEYADDLRWSLHASRNELYRESVRQTFAEYHKALLDCYQIGGIYDDKGREIVALCERRPRLATCRN